MTTLDDSYRWWVGKRVDVLQDDFTWKLGEVIEAERGVVHPFGDLGDEPYFYESTYFGDSDGHMRVILLDVNTRGQTMTVEIYPGGPLGIVPGVTPHAQFPVDVRTWWRELSPQAKAGLLAGAEGHVPAEVWQEVTEKGARLTGAYWPATQAGPEGFLLSSPHDDLVTDVRLCRAYIRAERRLQQHLSGNSVQAPLSLPVLDSEQREVWKARDQAKVALDEHRIVMARSGPTADYGEP